MKERALVDMPIDQIKVTGRYRSDLGDIKGLAASIAGPAGLINPVTVTVDGVLVAGQRRLEACRFLGWAAVPVIVVTGLTDAVAQLTAERDENEHRKEMTVSERVALGRALEELERPAAEERSRAARVKAGQVRQGTYKSGESASRSNELLAGPGIGQVRDIAARAVDMAPTTYHRAGMVVASATDPNLPEQVREVAQAALAVMDDTGRVNGAYNQVKAAKDAAAVAKPAPAPAAKPRAVGPAAIGVTPHRQRKALTNAANALSGMAHGLEQITELHPDITSNEAALWVGDLVKSRRVIERLINLLRERTSADA